MMTNERAYNSDKVFEMKNSEMKKILFFFVKIKINGILRCPYFFNN
jgi:hypothetical protein